MGRAQTAAAVSEARFRGNPPCGRSQKCFVFLDGKPERMPTRGWATAWEPYQELFQGVIRCLHADFRIGGLQPGETKHVHGKIYIVPNDMSGLLERYTRDFPEHVKRK